MTQAEAQQSSPSVKPRLCWESHGEGGGPSTGRVFAGQQRLYDPHQSAYQKGHGTALLWVKSDVDLALDAGKGIVC